MISAVSGYYGKLPISPEFLRLRAAGPEIRWLDEWLQRGVLYAKAKEGPQWTDLAAASSLWNFLLIPADHGRLVSGVVFASQDKAGRSFPFLSFLLVDRKPLAEQSWLIPVVVAGYLEAIGTALQALRQGGEWRVFQKQVEDWSEPLLPTESAAGMFDQYLRETTAATWFDGLRKNGNGQVTEWPGWWFAQVADQVSRLRRGKSGVALQLPLPSKSPQKGVDMALWLAACLEGRSTAQGPHAGLFSCWRQSAHPGESFALISPGPGSPSVVRMLVSPGAEDDAWQPMLPREIAAAASGVDHEVKEPRMLADPACSLKMLLNILQGTV